MSSTDITICPICGGREWRGVIPGDGFAILECARGCLARTDPVPPPEDAKAPEGGFALTREDALAAREFIFARRLLDLVGRITSTGRLLDIGCGGGHLVKAALDRGFDAVGLEISPLGVAYARQLLGLEPVVASFPEHRFDDGSFDVVVLKHVLEHLPDPLLTLSQVNRILRPGGIAVVECPNFDSLMRRARGARWPGLQPSQHTWQLSPSSIGALMTKADLRPVLTKVCALEYERGSGSALKWASLRALLALGDLLGKADNVTVIARKDG